jgi:hypothetical protein
VEQGNPLALQHLSMKYAKGQYGLVGIFKGVYMLFKNVPNVVKFVNTHVSYPNQGLELDH